VSVSEFRRVAEFQLSFARRQAAVVREFAGGIAVLDAEYAASHEHNQVIVDGQLIVDGRPAIEGAVTPAGLPALADELLGALPHRRITVLDDATGTACAPELTAAGYSHDVVVVMTHAGGPPAVAPLAEQVTVAELRPAQIRQLCAWMPQAGDHVIHQMADRRTARLRGADEVTFLAARDPDGVIASWADLYVDRAAGIAQVEDVMTAETHLRRGYADTVLATALHRAAGCGLIFLLAEANDWPRTWYARRGFTEIGRHHAFTRPDTTA
jgi:GNAT superfamily N-acetyltransferase